MRHPFFSAPRPQVFAHRGGAQLAPENTLDAFRNGVALGRDPGAAGAANRIERVVVNLATGDDGDLLVQEGDQRPQDTAFRLATQAEQDEIVP